MGNPYKYKQSTLSRVVDAYETLQDVLGRSPSALEVGRHLGVSFDWARNVLGQARREGRIKKYVAKKAERHPAWESQRATGAKLRKLDEYLTFKLLPLAMHLDQLIKSSKLPKKHHSHTRLHILLEDLKDEALRKEKLREHLSREPLCR